MKELTLNPLKVGEYLELRHLNGETVKVELIQIFDYTIQVRWNHVQFKPTSMIRLRTTKKPSQRQVDEVGRVLTLYEKRVKASMWFIPHEDLPMIVRRVYGSPVTSPGLARTTPTANSGIGKGTGHGC